MDVVFIEDRAHVGCISLSDRKYLKINKCAPTLAPCHAPAVHTCAVGGERVKDEAGKGGVEYGEARRTEER